MNEIWLAATVLGAGGIFCTALVIGNIISINRGLKEGDDQLRQHIIIMDTYNRQANRRLEVLLAEQEKWFKELGYTTHRIFERIDEPDENG